MTSPTPDAPTEALDLNQAFRGGANSVAFLGQINRASLVVLAQAGALNRPVATRIAAALATLFAQDGGRPSWTADYLDFEPRLLAVAGAEGSLLHTGRSRQDIASTIARMNLREGLLDELRAMHKARAALHALAARYPAAIVPAYTHGVQAQPTTFGHYLLGFADALQRSVQRLRRAYDGVNLCPLGSSVLNTSRFDIDRPRLAALLGFAGVVENAYDANHFATVDAALEAAASLSIAAVLVGQFAQDIHAQYADPSPWIQLGRGALMGISSAMPQKRNPAAIEQLRIQSSLLLGETQAVALTAHNVASGMFDYRGYDPVPARRAIGLFDLLAQVVGALVLDEARALEEVRADYGTSMEIADVLLQRCGVPFRTGHHFASDLTNFGRARRLRLVDIPHAEASRVYERANGVPLPLDAETFAEAVQAEAMVANRRGLGGPQPSEMTRMLARVAEEVAAEQAWLTAESDRLTAADAALDRAFDALTDV